ncbi:MAG: hypothetical protein EXS31_15940 [Pedosphaera sp.]|nr:hypothetical protein [Pedosphaera sp.]
MKSATQSYQATVDLNGGVRLLQPLKLKRPAKALVTILPDDTDEISLLSEDSLAQDWNRPEEDKAWEHLQPGR